MHDDVVRALTKQVQDALVEVVTERSEAGQKPLSPAAREALAGKTLTAALKQVDRERVAAGLPRLGRPAEEQIRAAVLGATTGLGWVDVVLADPTVEELVATRYDLWRSYHSDGTSRDVESPWRTEDDAVEWLSFVARTKGRTERQFNSQNPLLVMRLGPGLRLAATRDVSQHITFSLRRNVLGNVSLDGLAGKAMFPPVLTALFRALALGREMRWVIVGATTAGKTTLLRAMLRELPRERRIVVIEDTAEIDVFDPVQHPNVESWETREANSEGEGAIGHDALVAHALRYRPDLLTVGECRDSAAATPMLKAMTHGQASVTTVHAYDGRGGLDKLALFLGTGSERIPLEAAHHQLSQAVDFMIHVDRGTNGVRFVSEVVEVAGFDGRCTTNTIYTVAGGGRTFGRLTGPHADKLAHAGFDVGSLGSVR